MFPLFRYSARRVLSTRPFSTHLPARREAYVSPLTNMIDPLNSLSVDAIIPSGIHLSNNLIFPGPAIIVSDRAYVWNVDSPQPEDASTWPTWSEDRFKMFEIMSPRPEILIFGTGPTALPPPPFLNRYMHSLGIQLDVMGSRQAASLYNLLIEEGRKVALAVLPQRPVDVRTGVFDR